MGLLKGSPFENKYPEKENDEHVELIDKYFLWKGGENVKPKNGFEGVCQQNTHPL